MPENVLLITVDSLRYDRLSQSDASRNLTPTIDMLANDGTVFSNAFATGPGTQPSFPAILTGTYPLSYSGLGELSSDRPKIAKILRKEGFETAAFQTNPFLSERFNYDQGFKTYKDYQSSATDIATLLFPDGKIHPKLQILDEWFNVTENAKRLYSLFNERGRPYASAEQITTDTNAWLKNNRTPFFGWIHYMDVHHPCFPPKQYREKYGVPSDVDGAYVSELYSKMIKKPEKLTDSEVTILKKLYDAAIRYTDDQIGEIISVLKDIGLFTDTLIIVTSDHGEMFGEHNQFGKPVSMYDELIQVPLVITNGPSFLDEIADDLFSLLDLPPLIHDILDVDIPESYEGRLTYKNPREVVIAEHSRESDMGRVVIGARSERRLLEYDSEQNSYTVRDVTHRNQDELDESPPERLQHTILSRIENIELEKLEGVESMELDDSVESRLNELGYL